MAEHTINFMTGEGGTESNEAFNNAMHVMQELTPLCLCGHVEAEHRPVSKKCTAKNCRCVHFSRNPNINQGLPETIRETFPNDENLAGTLVVYCIGETIEVKARGLSPRQVVKIMCKLISKIF